MKILNKVYYFILLTVIVLTISGCTTKEQNSEITLQAPSSTLTEQLPVDFENGNEDKHNSGLEVKTEIDPTPAVEKPKETPPAVDLSKLPQTKELEFLLEGMAEKVPATLTLSDQGYGFYLLEGFDFAMEEPGKDMVFSKNSPDYFARIELLPADTNVNEVKSFIEEQLLATGDLIEIKVSELKGLVGDTANFSLYSTNSELSRHVILLEDPSVYFLVTLYLPNGEAMEGIAQRFYPMIETLIASK